MEHVVKIEVTVTGESARLYEILAGAAESVKPGQLNRAVLETGLVHHVLMLSAIGMVPEDRHDEVDELIRRIGRRTIMKDVFEQAGDYWRAWSESGAIAPDDEDEPT